MFQSNITHTIRKNPHAVATSEGARGPITPNHNQIFTVFGNSLPDPGNHHGFYPDNIRGKQRQTSDYFLLFTFEAKIISKAQGIERSEGRRARQRDGFQLAYWEGRPRLIRDRLLTLGEPRERVS